MNDPFELIAASLWSVEHGDLAKNLYRIVIEIVQRGGAVCFSETESEPLLWSHYSEKHHGCCIGFEVAENESLQKTIPIGKPNRIRVNMSPVLEFVRSGNFPIGDRDPQLQELSKEYEWMTRSVMLSKYDGWNYEKERRLLVSLIPTQRDGDYYFADFDESIKPEEVLLGLRSSEESEKKLLYAVNRYDPPLPIIRTTLASDAFKIVRRSEVAQARNE